MQKTLPPRGWLPDHAPHGRANYVRFPQRLSIYVYVVFTLLLVRGHITLLRRHPKLSLGVFLPQHLSETHVSVPR